MRTWSVRQARRGRGKAAKGEFVIEESVGYLVNRAARVLAHELAVRLQPHGVAIGQWAVLIFLWARDGMSQAELSRQVAIEPPTMVRTIDRMVRDGLVTRTPDPTDGRASRIHLTDRARSLRDALVPEAMGVNRAVEESMTKAEARTLRRLLQKLVASTPELPADEVRRPLRRPPARRPRSGC